MPQYIKELTNQNLQSKTYKKEKLKLTSKTNKQTNKQAKPMSETKVKKKRKKEKNVMRRYYYIKTVSRRRIGPVLGGTLLYKTEQHLCSVGDCWGDR
jgi:hypothetical protein